MVDAAIAAATPAVAQTQLFRGQPREKGDAKFSERAKQSKSQSPKLTWCLPGGKQIPLLSFLAHCVPRSDNKQSVRIRTCILKQWGE